MVREGHTFEREAITRWLANSDINPSTLVPLKSKRLTPNISLRHALEAYLEEHKCTEARFRAAADAGDVAAVADMWLLPSFLDRPESRSGVTAIAAAAARRDDTMVSWLLAAGARADAPTKLRASEEEEEMGTALHQAAISGCLKSTAALLAAGADPLAITGRGETALHLCTSGEVAALLIARDARTIVARTTAHKSAPLHHAAFWARLSVVEMLIAKGADVNLADAQGSLALGYAISKTSAVTTRVACIRALMPTGAAADVYLRGSKTDANALMIHVQRSLQPNAEIIRTLVSLGVDVAEGHGSTVVHYACLNKGGAVAALKALQIAGILSDSRVDINARETGETRHTALEIMLNADVPSQDAIEVLLSCGADPTLVGADGNSALSMCLAASTAEKREILFRAQAAVTRDLRAANAAQASQLSALKSSASPAAFQL